MPSATDKTMLLVSKKTARKRNVDAMSRSSSFDEANNCLTDTRLLRGAQAYRLRS
jgi:hypothetical protein